MRTPANGRRVPQAGRFGPLSGMESLATSCCSLAVELMGGYEIRGDQIPRRPYLSMMERTRTSWRTPSRPGREVPCWARSVGLVEVWTPLSIRSRAGAARAARCCRGRTCWAAQQTGMRELTNRADGRARRAGRGANSLGQIWRLAVTEGGATDSRSFRQSGRRRVWCWCEHFTEPTSRQPLRRARARTAPGRAEGVRDSRLFPTPLQKPETSLSINRPAAGAVRGAQIAGSHVNPVAQEGARSFAQSAAFREVGTETEFATEGGGFFGFVRRPAIRSSWNRTKGLV